MKPAHILSAAAALAAPILMVMAAPAFAHHSGAMFDREKTVTINGTIKEFNWMNPHSSFSVEVPRAGGATELWAIEMNGPQNLVRKGWKRTTLKPGDKVKAVVNPMRDGKPGGWYQAITLPDGTTLKETDTP